MSDESGGSAEDAEESVGDPPDGPATDPAGQPTDDGWSEGWESAAERTTDAEGDETGSEGEKEEADDYEPSIAGVFGARPEDAPPRPEIVPESPSLENVLFVLLGVLFGLFVIYRAVVAFTA